MSKSLADIKEKTALAGYFVIIESSNDLAKIKSAGGISLAQGLALSEAAELAKGTKLVTCRFLGFDLNTLNCDSTILVSLREDILSETEQVCDGEKVFRVGKRQLAEVSYVSLSYGHSLIEDLAQKANCCCPGSRVSTIFPPPGYDAWHIFTGESCTGATMTWHGIRDVTIARGQYLEVPVDSNKDEIKWHCAGNSLANTTWLKKGLTSIMIDWRRQVGYSADSSSVWVPN